jgi:hypothetical protein
MSPSQPRGPATNRADAFNRCDPAVPLPAGDERYVDLAAGRGEEGGAVAKCRECIRLSKTPLVQLLAGHRGCGKSTELRRLERDLEGDGFFVAYFEADVDLDLEDTEPVDVPQGLPDHPVLSDASSVFYEGLATGPRGGGAPGSGDASRR